MKNKEIEILLHAAVMAHADKNSPAVQYYADLCGGLDAWCRGRHRHDSLFHSVIGIGMLATLTFSSATVMASQLPDCKMNVTEPFIQQHMYDRAREMSDLL